MTSPPFSDSTWSLEQYNGWTKKALLDASFDEKERKNWKKVALLHSRLIEIDTL